MPKKTLETFLKNYRSFYPKIFNYALQNMVLGSENWDPEKNLFRIRNTEENE
jgi:hypothetical protein